MSLILGATGSGKTLLLKRLETIDASKNGTDYSEIPATVSTVGTNLVNVPLTRRQDITVRELGGCMGPIWKNYYKDANSLMYVIDVSNRLQVAASCIQLLTVLSSNALRKVPVLLIFNKMDMPDKMTTGEIETLYRLSDLQKSSQRPISIVEVSASNGDGLGEIIKWLDHNAYGKG